MQRLSKLFIVAAFALFGSAALAQTVSPISGGGGAASDITVGTSVITGGTNTRVLFDNVGVLGEYAISGTGSVCMTTNCQMTTPTLGVAAGTSLALGGATIGPNALAVTGSSLFTGNMTFSADNTYDVGASGATRPRTVYAGTSIVAPTGTFSGTDLTINTAAQTFPYTAGS